MSELLLKNSNNIAWQHCENAQSMVAMTAFPLRDYHSQRAETVGGWGKLSAKSETPVKRLQKTTKNKLGDASHKGQLKKVLSKIGHW